MKDRKYRRGKIKFKTIYSLIGDQCHFIVVDQRHTLLFDSDEWESFAGWKLGNMKVTDIKFSIGNICYTIYASKKFTRKYWRLVKKRRRRSINQDGD